MSSRTKNISFIVGTLLFVGGFVLGSIIKHFPYLKLDPKVNVVELATLIATIAIAFMIPVYVQKFIEDNRGIKSSLVEELKELLAIISKIKTIISDSHIAGSFVAKNRDDILFAFNEAELMVNSIEEQFQVAYKDECSDICEGLKNLLFTYQDYLTGGDLMLSSFIKVDDRFFRENSTEYSKIETGIKTLIQKVHKL